MAKPTFKENFLKNSTYGYLIQTKQFKIPWASLGISLMLIIAFQFRSPATESQSQFVEQFQEDGVYNKFLSVIYEFCYGTDQRSGSICKQVSEYYPSVVKKLSGGAAISIDESTHILTSAGLIDNFLTKNPAYSSKVPSIKNIEVLKDTITDSISDVRLQRHELSKATIDLYSLTKAQFSHANTSHLYGNIFALLFFGLIIESWMGSAAFLFTYFVGGFVGLFIYTKFFAPPNVVVLGASANISAIIGAYFIFYLTSFRRYRQVQIKTSFVVELLYITHRLFSTDIVGGINGKSNVAHMAHLIGAGAGCVLAVLIMNEVKARSSIAPKPAAVLRTDLRRRVA